MNKNISLKESIAVLIVLLALLGVLIIGFQLSPHIPILAAFMCLLFYGRFKKFSWDEIHDGIVKGITPGIIPILIFLLIGVLVASWILSGTIPTIMVYGFKLVSVRFFLPTAFLVCAIVGVTVGSSFTTISTMGIAFLGIGHLLGFNDAMTTGAVVSGAFLGNNCSPLSDTTNLAAGIGGVNLFEHIAGMRYTDFPAFVLSLLFYTILGQNSHSADLASINEMIQNMKASFWISPWTLIPLVILFGGAIKKIPAIPTLLAGSTAALVLSFIHEKSLTIGKAADILMNGYVAHTPDPKLDELLSRGGIMSMLGSASLILLALALGGLLIKYLIVETIVQELKEKMDRPSRLVGFTALSCIGVNLIVGEQYLSIILPGETFKRSFDEVGLSKNYLTRTLADSGATVNSLVPWGVSGTFIMGTMKVSALHYLPFAFFSILAPVFTIIGGFLLNRRHVKN
ncbi:Na+/H+ antiporter NhaC [Enterococcus faecium]|uniref:Na+/H+ antiporter NhaC n=1 Tax=Enterococcus faecium TaxID=1352 RepID=UPI0001B6F236|nr:Na+/H+ antiporter NhaC [Enterococcus faecium]EEV56793.1 Na+/H+ antiporter NhaC [Enterococcus faecium 1,231,408]EGP5213913.1 Na+/H+ antiporter NhaC [Enterococcus faecium]EGP5709974.1 Na+/H+ antiporter NhaC [Enterococcus faecium]MBG8077720.1 Na+/H+ antiporter NhaC [Enterococcus faecium]